MPAQPIDIESDPRVQHAHAVLNGISYHYLLALPAHASFRATVFLIHGWPDISAGWRYQVPLFLEHGFRVVCPDLMGFGMTEAPKVPPNPINLYGMKRAADDIAELARQLGAPKIILGGHDWGGDVAWRTALWHPDLVACIFTVCTPYTAPMRSYVSLDELVEGPLPNFGYQKQLVSGELETRLQTRDQIEKFLIGMYNGRGPNGESGFDPRSGVLFDNLAQLRPWSNFSGKDLDYYARQYAASGLHGTLNWYRTREVNFQDELLLTKRTIDVPTLFIFAKRETVLTRNMGAKMGKYIPKLTRREVDAGHWALWQRPDEVNAHIKAWLQEIALVGGGGGVLGGGGGHGTARSTL